MRLTRLCPLLLGLGLAPAAWGQGAPGTPSVSRPIEVAYEAVRADPRVSKALDGIKADDGRTFEEQKRIAQIPSPPFGERARAAYFLQRLREVGLADAALDQEGNVIAVRKGASSKPRLVVSAHLDTVFPEGTDLTVKERDGTTLAPGIGDDARGLAALLSLVQALNRSDIKTVGDVVFVGTVGEEELGNLRGVRALFRDHADIDGFISIDGLSIGRIVNQATGSHRYEMTFKGPGGHSFQEFGRPSAIHAMGRAIAKIADVQTPTDPKTTFTVGTVQGGTSVNAIAAEARMTLDMRSNSTDDLLRVEENVLRLVRDAVAEENRRWNSGQLGVEIKLIGDRPAGAVPEDAPIVQTSRRVIAALSPGSKITLAGASTDSNLAISLGIPAVTIGGGGDGGSWHSLAEWYKPDEAYLGPQNALLILLMLVGVDGVSQPVLIARTPR